MTGSDNKLRIAGIVKESIADGPGIRYVVFTQGCKHNCAGCHNPHTHSFEGGTLIDIADVLSEMRKNPMLDGVTLSGGEPFEQAEILDKLAREVHSMGLNVMTYTGYTYEHITENTEKRPGWDDFLGSTDILVDGRFEIENKNLMLRFRGSSNQRIIDVAKSRTENKIIWAEV